VPNRRAWVVLLTALACGPLARGRVAIGTPTEASAATAASTVRTGRFSLPPSPPEEPLPAAQRHLRKAREYSRASCEMARDGCRHALDGFYVACQEAWNAVWTCPDSPEILFEAAERYADALAGFLQTATEQRRITPAGVWIGPPGRTVLVPLVPKALPIDASRIGSIQPQAQADDPRITRRHLRAGFGLPVIVRVAKPSSGEAIFVRQRQSLAATAVLRFDLPGGENVLQKFVGSASRDHAAAVLDLANPIEIAAVQIGPARPHLAADLTAPLLDLLEAMPRDGLAGFVQPFGRGDTEPRLEFLEPHQPGRIPVVFIHGLASDEGTWFDLINELRAWPVFHRRFEPWLFHYPTGAAFSQSSLVLRQELRRAVATLEADDRDSGARCGEGGLRGVSEGGLRGVSEGGLRRMILVGHSMGGLHAKMQVVSSGDALWNAIALQPLESFNLPPQARKPLQERWFFEPAPFVKRVVCIATPHRGSALASRAVGRLASLVVRQPEEMSTMHQAMTALNPDGFRPEYRQRMPTTVDLLEPNSPLLAAMDRLRPAPWVTFHSVHGDVHWSPVGRDDWVVPVSSALTAHAVSELAVPACHTRVHHHPETVAELRRILEQHLRETAP
jgi:pimeloyl-ACP methyl ester carboxylesterase